jgi:hypothetical protein
VEDEGALDALDDGRHLASVEEHGERFDELSRAAEALARCKPQEVTALVLKAQGLSYAEIAERQNWSYTKVDRCLKEGRRAFLDRFAGIESGAECARWTAVLSAMADGEAPARDVMAVRPHLRNCPSCRATLAAMQRAPAAAAALMPAGLVVGTGSGAGGLLARLGELVVGAQDRVAAPLVKAQSAMEAASVGKVAAVTASVAAMAGGGVAVQQRVADAPARAGEPPMRTVTDERPVAATTGSASASGTDGAKAATARTGDRPRTETQRPAQRTDDAGRDDATLAPPGAEFSPESPESPVPETPVKPPAPDASAAAPAGTTAPVAAPSPSEGAAKEPSEGGEFGFE